MRIMIGGFPPDTTEDEIRKALEDYGVEVKGLSIQTPNNLARYLATVDVDLDKTGCKVLTEKINNRFWKGHRLKADYFLFEAT
ncbi:MAG: hypothetical protein JSW10_03060 [Pseudomonadota bacterium]|nr:MAG: hypothetical protein JSW10_03060 [Pseudomonadota bacterium]